MAASRLAMSAPPASLCRATSDIRRLELARPELLAMALLGPSDGREEARVRLAPPPTTTRLAPPSEATYASRPDANIRRLQESISTYLGASVTLQHRQNGKGKLTINYGDLEQLDGILERIGLPNEDEQ